MKKLLIISLALFASCNNEKSEKVQEVVLTTDSIKVFTSDTVQVDSIEAAISALLHNTENADKKIKEFKAIKKENKVLKQELVETKAELEQVKAVLADTVSEPVKKKKKTFIQKVISTIKKDTVK
jgi:hypothetical protein